VGTGKFGFLKKLKIFVKRIYKFGYILFNSLIFKICEYQKNCVVLKFTDDSW
jgi:hypothetical protein